VNDIDQQVLALVRKAPQTSYSIGKILFIDATKNLRRLENQGLVVSVRERANGPGRNRYGYKIVYRGVNIGKDDLRQGARIAQERA